jgi:hypothetical protein
MKNISLKIGGLSIKQLVVGIAILASGQNLFAMDASKQTALFNFPADVRRYAASHDGKRIVTCSNEKNVGSPNVLACTITMWKKNDDGSYTQENQKPFWLQGSLDVCLMGCIRWLKNSNQTFSVIFKDFHQEENGVLKRSETVQYLALDAPSLKRVEVTDPLSGLELDMRYRTFAEDRNDFLACGPSDQYSLTMNQIGSPKLRTNDALAWEALNSGK